MSTPHLISWLAPEDRGRRGRRRLSAFGRYHVAALAGAAAVTVRAAAKSGIPLHEPVEAVAWAVKFRGYPRLADQVLEALGYPPRYCVADPGSSGP